MLFCNVHEWARTCRLNRTCMYIVQVDPHVHAFIPLTIIRLFTRPYAIPSYDHHDLHFQS